VPPRCLRTFADVVGVVGAALSLQRNEASLTRQNG
jgi:hypothetical protein